MEDAYKPNETESEERLDLYKLHNPNQWQAPKAGVGHGRLGGLQIGGAAALKPLTVIEELRRRRMSASNRLQRLVKETADTEIELDHCDRAIAALEAPAQPLDESGDQIPDDIIEQINAGTPEFSGPVATIGSLIDAQTTDPVDPRVERASDEPEIPEGFTKWEGGYCPLEIGTEVEVLSRKCGTWPVTIKPEAPLLWEHEGHDLDIIAYRILEAPAPEQDASVETQHDEPIPDDIVRLPEIVTDLWQQGYDDKANGYEPSLAEPEYTKGYEARALIEREHRETMERAKFFDGGMMADADRHAREQSIMEKAGEALAAIFKREKEPA